MQRSPTARRVLTLALGCCLALGLLVPASSAAEQAWTTYPKESAEAYEQQLASHQIVSVTVNKRLRWLRLTLKDGRQVVYQYPPKHEPQFAAQLKAKHVPVSVLAPAAARKEARKVIHPHHKLRYIVGGAVLALIIVLGSVWLIKRRRRLAME
jgi:hypothetical protein